MWIYCDRRGIDCYGKVIAEAGSKKENGDVVVFERGGKGRIYCRLLM